jgi:hypothetical protein
MITKSKMDVKKNNYFFKLIIIYYYKKSQCLAAKTTGMKI